MSTLPHVHHVTQFCDQCIRFVDSVNHGKHRPCDSHCFHRLHNDRAERIPKASAQVAGRMNRRQARLAANKQRGLGADTCPQPECHTTLAQPTGGPKEQPQGRTTSLGCVRMKSDTANARVYLARPPAKAMAGAAPAKCARPLQSLQAERASMRRSACAQSWQAT